MLASRLFLSLLVLFSVPAFGAELSLISGLYQDEEIEAGGTSVYEKNTISFGGRYADEYDVDMMWYAQALVELISYDHDNAPSDANNISLGGGLRMYFDAFTQGIVPFGQGGVSYKAEESGDGTTTTETSGILYSMAVGVRFDLDRNFFFDLELPMFESGLRVTEETERTTTTTTADGETTTKSKSERSVTELYADTEEPLPSMKVVLGMKL